MRKSNFFIIADIFCLWFMLTNMVVIMQKYS